MTEHETALVAILLERLKMVDSAPKDAEAETLIRQMTADQPDSAYHLVQTVLIQDLSLHVAQTRITDSRKVWQMRKRSASYLLAYWAGHLLPTSRLQRPARPPEA